MSKELGGRMRTKLGYLIFAAGVLTALGTRAHATPFDIDDFMRVSAPEFLSPRFDVGGGQTSARDYSGYVEVIVEGFGLNIVSAPHNPSDAFYNFVVSANTHTLFDNTLRIGTETQLEPSPRGFPFRANCSLHVECGALHVAELAVAYEGMSFAVSGAFPLDVNAGYAPEYNPAHRYRFVLDLDSYVGRITLGYGDGGTSDNSSDVYDITLYQAAFAPVPEPGALALFAVGLAGLGLLDLRRRRRAGPASPKLPG